MVMARHRRSDLRDRALTRHGGRAFESRLKSVLLAAAVAFDETVASSGQGRGSLDLWDPWKATFH